MSDAKFTILVMIGAIAFMALALYGLTYALPAFGAELTKHQECVLITGKEGMC